MGIYVICGKRNHNQKVRRRDAGSRYTKMILNNGPNYIVQVKNRSNVTKSQRNNYAKSMQDGKI